MNDLHVKIHLIPRLRNHGFALPPFGIFVGSEDKCLVMHETGHLLQAKKYGLLKFYFCYAIPSVLSFWFFRKGHKRFYAETDANRLAIDYFKSRISETDLENFKTRMHA